MIQPRTVVNTLLHEKKRKISGGFYHRLQVDFAYNSNHIEGSRLTHEQTRYIFETHTVDGTAHVNDILEAANHFKCIDYVLDTVNEPITEAYIKHLHRLLKTGLLEDDYDDVVIGDYKKYPNEVGQIRTVHPKEVATHMQSLINEFSAKPQISLHDLPEMSSQDSVADAVEDRMLVARLHTYLHRLDEPYKEVFLLRVFAELRYSEIGRLFGKNESWAGVTFFRAKKKIIAMMEEDEQHESTNQL